MPSTPEIRRAKRLARRAAVEGETGTYAREQNDAVTVSHSHKCVATCDYRCAYTVKAVTLHRDDKGCVSQSDITDTLQGTHNPARVS